LRTGHYLLRSRATEAGCRLCFGIRLDFPELVPFLRDSQFFAVKILMLFHSPHLADFGRRIKELIEWR
jgi:hypothetical protein